MSALRRDVVLMSGLAQMRSANRLGNCPLIGEDRKSSAHPQNDVMDPKRHRGKRPGLEAMMKAVNAKEYLAVTRRPTRWDWGSDHQAPAACPFPASALGLSAQDERAGRAAGYRAVGSA
jgi:hypothetical protein